jgi:hypothetical protein
MDTLSSPCQFHHRGQFFRPLNPILFSATTVRRRDTTLPSFSAATITSPRPHGLPIVAPRVATTGYPGGCGWPMQPRCDHRKKPSVGIASTKLPILLSSTWPSPFVLIRLVFGQPATSPPLPFAPFLTEQAVPPSSLVARRRSSGVGPKKNSSHAATHDSVHGGIRVASLDIGRDVSLHCRRNLSALSFPCTHSPPAPSWTTLR